VFSTAFPQLFPQSQLQYIQHLVVSGGSSTIDCVQDHDRRDIVTSDLFKY